MESGSQIRDLASQHHCFMHVLTSTNVSPVFWSQPLFVSSSIPFILLTLSYTCLKVPLAPLEHSNDTAWNVSPFWVKYKQDQFNLAKLKLHRLSLNGYGLSYTMSRCQIKSSYAHEPELYVHPAREKAWGNDVISAMRSLTMKLSYFVIISHVNSLFSWSTQGNQ